MCADTASVMAAQTDNSTVQQENHVHPGVISDRILGDTSRQHYLLYVPRKSNATNAPVFITVHGISRNAREHARRFAPFAERYGVILVAPVFSQDRFPDYQRLGRKGKGERADIALNNIIDEVGRLTGAKTDKLFLFGYSGGAQFVHRYAMVHSDRVAKLVLGAPGWYTFPDPTVKFPRGIAQTKSLPDVTFDPKNFLTIDTCVLVGERDTRQDAALNKSAKIVQQQGENRRTRGGQWVAVMMAAARSHGFETPYTFKTVPFSRHSFSQSMRRGKMGEMVFECLFGTAK
ncbi:MAG: hypothetical protein ABL860_00750 [Candidatus Nitrotoga sp.]